jgi:phosphate transport system substrate-binding protein
MGFLRAALISALFSLAWTQGLRAQDVTLSSPDGGVSVTGKLLGFDGLFYRIASQYGEVTVDGSAVRCSGSGCQDPDTFVADIQLSGSAAMGKVLMPALIEAFALRRTLQAVREPQDDNHFSYRLTDEAGRDLGIFRFRVTTTNEGFADLLADEADIVMAQREIRPTEARLAREAGLGALRDQNRSQGLALDALVPVVAPHNPVQTISLADLSLVLSGQIDNWQDLGGPDAPISIHLRLPNSGINQAIEDRLLRPAQLSVVQNVTRHQTDQDLVQAVARDTLSLGLTSFTKIGPSRALALTGACGFTLQATRRNVKTEDYPLTAPIFLYLPARRLPELARDFLSFTRSPAAQVVIRRVGFVDQAPESLPLSLQGDRLANAILVAQGADGLDGLQKMTTALKSMQRLTTTFRFEKGSANLDAQSRSNVQQLAASLRSGRYDNRRLTFVGFSDGQGTTDANKIISKQRAEAVISAVLSALGPEQSERVAFATEAYGEAMPMGCDDTRWGRQINRRVEVWLQ